MSKAAEPAPVEPLVDALAELAPIKARALAEHLKVDYIRTGRTRGTRWWLG